MQITGYTVGVYDLFNVGHLRQLAAARSRCMRLVAGVIDDAEAERRYGARPFVPTGDRMDLLRSLDCVDDVVLAAGSGKFGGRPDLVAVPAPRRGTNVASPAPWWAPPAPIKADLLILGTDPHAPLSIPLAEAVAGAIPVVRLADVHGTASAILRAALTHSSVA